MKKIQHMVLSFCLILGLIWYPNIQADAAGISLGVSASTVKIGDTVTVSVTVPENISATVDLSFSADILSFSSASADVNANGGTIRMNVGKYSLAASNTISVTFAAKTSGSASVSASAISAVDNDTTEEVGLDGASTGITVENQAPEQPTAPPADTPAAPPADTPAEQPKSADNSLSSLKLSSGTLSPKFQYSVTNYTAVVGYDVEKLVVSAAASNENAVIESVTGNGNVKLEVGENTIQIVVRAENGVKATYTVVVTRLAEEESTGGNSESESESGTESETQEEEIPPTENILQWNGQILKPTEGFPNEVLPADFVITSIMINNIEVPCAAFSNGDLKILYLANEEGTENLYVYDELQQIVYPFVKIEAEKTYILILLPNETSVPLLTNIVPCTLSIEGKGIIHAYQFVQTEEDETEAATLMGQETFYAAEPVMTEFYLIYGMNHMGEKGWYLYDSIEGTFQRYVGVTPISDAETEEPEENTQDYEKLLGELAQAQNKQMMIICISAFVMIVLVVIIINLILRNRLNEGYEGDDEYDDEYDEEDDEYDENEYDFEESSEVAEDLEESEAEEVEVEFYEIGAEESEDGEVEVEFYEIGAEESEAEEAEVEFYEIGAEESEDGEVEVEFYEIGVEESEAEEVEVEFYEMSDEAAETMAAKEDEVEVEFCNMEELLVKEADASGEASSETEQEIPAEKMQNKSADLNEADDDDLEFIELD